MVHSRYAMTTVSGGREGGRYWTMRLGVSLGRAGKPCAKHGWHRSLTPLGGTIRSGQRQSGHEKSKW